MVPDPSPPAPIIGARRVGGRSERFGPAIPLPLWSFTKTLIAALCHDAAARRELSLDDALPDRDWTLRDLLGHRAGLGDYGALPAYKAAVARGDAPWSTARFLTEVSPDAPLFGPGKGWRYSNVGHLLARQTLEAATNAPLATLLAERLAGYSSLRLADTAADFAGFPFAVNGYHPGWVAHGCALATPADAVRLLADILARFPGMDAPRDLGGPVPGRIWARAGYGLGLMSGRVAGAGRAVGPSGGGAFSACAVYAFPDLPGAPVAAAFVVGGDAAPAERAARDLAIGTPLHPGPARPT